MRLEDMSFYDYLLAECEYREKQRKERRMEITINKEWAREAVQPVIDNVKANYIPKSVIDDIRTEIYNLHPIKRGDNDYANGAYDGQCWILDKALYIIDKYTK